MMFRDRVWKTTRIKLLDLRKPEAVARAERIAADCGLDWDFRPVPDVGLSEVELAVRRFRETYRELTALAFEIAEHGMRA